MSTKTIPAQTVKTCDVCTAVMDGKTARHDGGLVLKADGLDMHGHAVGDATRRLDLCDSCLHAVSTAIEAAIAPRRPKANDS